MCLALPAQIVEINGTDAVAEIDGVRLGVSLALLDDVSIGDFVIIHVGFALSRVSAEEAARTYALLADIPTSHRGDPMQ